MLSKRLTLVIGIAVLAALPGLCVGASASSYHPGLLATAAGANLWVDSDGGRCARSDRKVAYQSSRACASLDAAWDACRAGDRIAVVASVYGPQAITGNKAAPGCAIAGQRGTTIGDLQTSGSFFTLENVTVDVGSDKQEGWKDRASNVTLKNVALHGPFVTVDLYRVSNVRWLGGELGVAGRDGGRRVCGEDAQPVQIGEADHILFSGVRFHPQDADLTPSSCSSNGQHLEMIRLDGGTSFFTLRDSTFDSGDHSNTASIFITEPGGSIDPHDLTFENNFFGRNAAAVGTFQSHQNVSPCVNFTFAYNTFLTTPGAFQCISAENVRWIGNLGPLPPGPVCFGSRVDNVWQDTNRDNCGSDKWIVGPRGRTNELGLGGDGFHLGRRSPAVDAGEAAGYCIDKLRARDHDGARRQIGIRCDAGADEYQKDPAVVATVGATRWRHSALTVSLRVRERVTADVRVLQGSRTVARTKAVLVAQRRQARLVLRGIDAPGSVRLVIVLTDVAGNKRTIQRTLMTLH
jgi:hypothetical protein